MMSHMPPGPAEVRRDILILGIGAAVIFLFFLGARDLWNPNEPIYGLATKEMAERGDWLVPSVNGEVFAEKPILYFWLSLATSKALGAVNECTLRIPCALAGIVSTLFLYLLVYPYADRRRAMIAAGIFTTIYMVFWGARAVQMDVFVMASTLGVLLPVSRVLDHRLAPAKGWALAGIAVGIGFLAKGPVAIVLPGIAYVAYVIATGRYRAIVTSGMIPAFLAAGAVASPWYLALWFQGRTDVLYEVLIRQNFVRFVEAWDHQAPWWYYLEYFWIDMAPWAFLVPLAIRLPGRDGDERRLDLLAWIWIIGTVAFFSLSDSKRSAYILPLAPAVAILASAVLARLMEGRLPRFRRVLALTVFIALATVFFGAGMLIAVRVPVEHPDLSLHAYVLAVVMILGSLATASGMIVGRNPGWRVPVAFFTALVCLYMVASGSSLPAIDRFKSARGFADEVNEVVAPDDPVASFRFWRWRSEYAYYTGRRIRNLESMEELGAYWRGAGEKFLIVEEHHVDEARPALGGAQPILSRQVGSKTAYLFGPGRQDDGEGVDNLPAR